MKIISYDSIGSTTLTGQPVKQSLPEPKREKHRVRKTKIGVTQGIHPVPPQSTTTEFPRLEYAGPHKTIERPEKDEPFRFFAF